MKDRRKGEVLDAFGFLPLFLLVRFALCFLRSQSLLVWWNEALCPGEDRAREHKPTGYTEVHRTRQVASEAAGGAGQYHCEDAVYHLGNTMDQGRFLLAGGKQTSHLLSGRARRRRIWGATGCSASFRPWVDYGANPPGSHFKAHEEGDWKQPVQLHQGQITHALIAFYNEMSDCDVYLDISKAFGTISGSIVVTKLVRYGLHKWMIRWMKTDCTAGLKIL